MGKKVIKQTINEYLRGKKEIDFENTKIDNIRSEGNLVFVGEVKNSSKYLPAAEVQLMFYLQAQASGFELKGFLFN